MLDFFNLPNNERAPNSDIQIFVGTGTNSGLSPNLADIHEWKKPRGITMLHILCVGAGGGGGGGFSAAAGSAKGGGGGGGAGALVNLIIPAMFVPDKLYVLPGNGGKGGSAGGAGNFGTTSCVFIYPDANFNPANLLIISASSGTTIASAGGAGTAAAGGAGGSGMTAASTPSTCIFAQCGVMGGQPGGGGSAGGAPGANGNNFTHTTPLSNVLPGTGGGGSTSGAPTTSGGVTSFTSSGMLGPIKESAPSAAGPGAVGGSGSVILRSPVAPFFVYGGLGAGGSDASVGAPGGNGAWGSGGGGGGSGTTGGAGGDGGAGVVIITGW
jgi:hypothetical protein